MAADVLGLSDRIEIVPANTRDESGPLRQQNPLGKMPCLVTADGTAIYDSGVIMEYLQELSGTSLLLQLSGQARYEALTRAKLADGIADATILIAYEGRYHEPHQCSQDWMDHQRGKIRRSLAAFTHRLPDPRHIDIVSIGLCCALGYVDRRKPLDWRAEYMLVAAWLEELTDLHPVVVRTAAEEG